jgi:hypothetical protein
MLANSYYHSAIDNLSLTLTLTLTPNPNPNPKEPSRRDHMFNKYGYEIWIMLVEHSNRLILMNDAK